MNNLSGATAYPTVWDKPPFIKKTWLRWSIILGGVIYLIAALASMNIDVQRVLEGIPRGQRFIESFFPPNFAVMMLPIFRLSREQGSGFQRKTERMSSVAL